MNKTERLYYYGIDIEVLKGDFVVLKTFLLRRKKKGRVSYIPEQTASELGEQGKDSDDWLIELDDKTVTGWLYSPVDLQPSKRLKLISRGEDNYNGITSEDIEKYEQEIEKEGVSWWESLIGSLLVIAVLVGIGLLIKSLFS